MPADFQGQKPSDVVVVFPPELRPMDDATLLRLATRVSAKTGVDDLDRRLREERESWND